MTDTALSPPAAAPRRTVLRWAAGAAIFMGAAAAALAIGRFYEGKFARTTGDAAWVWSDHRIAADEPEAFFLVRDFDLPDQRQFVRIRVAADPEYTLWFNGLEIGGRSGDGRALDAYEVTPFARESGNRIVLAVRSPRGVGGVLATVDLAPMKQNWLGTDGRWRLYPAWSDELLRPGPVRLPHTVPRILGRPPFGRWNYPRDGEGQPYAARRVFHYPRSAAQFDSWLPKIEVKSGVAVAGRVPARATAFDFGGVVARPAIRVAPGRERAIAIRFASYPQDLQKEGEISSLVVGEGEREVTSAQTRPFRYLIVYDEPVEAWAVGE
ncbi:MAG TPA: hypothetical protein VGE86_00575 [Thermoanaerobaculia bacterium]